MQASLKDVFLAENGPSWRFRQPGFGRKRCDDNPCSSFGNGGAGDFSTAEERYY